MGAAGFEHARADGRAGFAAGLRIHFAELHRWHFYVQINAVEQRPGNAAEVVLNFARAAAAFGGHLAVGRGVHCGDEHELRRERHRARRAADGDVAVLERLTHGFQNAAAEFGQFVQKQNAVMGQRNFAGRGVDVAAEQSCIACRVMRRAEGALRDERLLGLEQSGDAMDAGGLERFIQSKRRQDGAEPLGDHTFARARRADENQIVPARGSDFQRTLHGFLPLHFGEVVLAIGLMFKQRFCVHIRGRDGRGAGDEACRLAQIFHGDDLQAFNDRCLGRVIRRHQQTASPFRARAERHGQHTLHAPHFSGERQLTDDCVVRRVADARLFAGHQPCDPDCQIKARPFLAQIGWGEVDGRFARRQMKARAGDRGGNALHRFPHGGIRQADDHNFLFARSHAHFHLYRHRFHPA